MGIRALLIALLGLALASPAEAREAVRGPGYHFVLPEGFQRAPASVAPEVQQHVREWVAAAGLPLAGHSRPRVYVHIGDYGTEAALVALRYSVPANAGMESTAGVDLEAFRRALQSKMIGLGDPEVRTLERGPVGPDMTGVHVEVLYTSRDGRPMITRLAFVVAHGHCVVLGLDAPVSGSLDYGEGWQQTLAGLSLEPTSEELGQWIRVGGLALGGALLLIAILMLIRRQRSPTFKRQRAALRMGVMRPAPTPDLAASTSGSRALDGIGTFGGDGATARPGDGAAEPQVAAQAPEPEAPVPAETPAAPVAAVDEVEDEAPVRPQIAYGAEADAPVAASPLEADEADEADDTVAPAPEPSYRGLAPGAATAVEPFPAVGGVAPEPASADAQTEEAPKKKARPTITRNADFLE